VQIALALIVDEECASGAAARSPRGRKCNVIAELRAWIAARRATGWRPRIDQEGWATHGAPKISMVP